VIHKGKKTLGIVMNLITGVFVDIAKVSQPKLIGRILKAAAAGQKVDTSEMGLVRLLAPTVKILEPPQDVLAALCTDLERLLAGAQEIVINDLQFVVQPNGHLVVIDPQWAGPRELMKEQEARFIQDTYRRLQAALQELRGSKPLPVKSHVTKFQNRFGKDDDPGPKKGGFMGPPMGGMNNKFIM
jgi:hypothetical protein